MKATVLLADWAEAINGKLYVQGGGWVRTTLNNGLLNCALAVRFLVGWDETNKQHVVTIRLVNEDGQVFTPQIPGLPEAQPVEVKNLFEVGRPAGMTPGSEVDAVMAMQFLGIPIPKGRYTFTLDINDESFDTGATFNVI